MMITPDDKPTNEMQADDPPPSYDSQVVSESSSPAFKTKPTNFLALSNDHDSIKGQFVIDPSISIPPNMLPALGDGEMEADRKNLSLKSKYSSVRAEIWLLAPPRDSVTKSRRTTIALTSNHGSINAEVHTADGAPPFSLTANCPHSSIRIAIPPSFQGLLSLSTHHGSVSLSDAMLANATQLSQQGDARQFFIGDFNSFGEGEWLGDQMVLDSTHGSIRLKYVEEVADGQGKKGLLSRLFKR